MSFRKRNVALSSTGEAASKASQAPSKAQLPGVKPSSIDGRPVTSTGNAALDGLLAGHGGLALGCSLLVEESGTTDYAGALLKFYAAEGILQGHHVHVLGLPEQWGRELPGAASEIDKKDRSGVRDEKMKIAWRYESLGQFGMSTTASREPLRSTSSPTEPPHSSGQPTPFNHTFDLSKRLQPPANFSLTFHLFSPSPQDSPYNLLLSRLTTAIHKSPTTPHRLIIPSLLSPLLYPPMAAQPHHLLSFLHSLRALLSLHPLTIFTTLPLSISPRSTGLTRWLELLHDGVIELSPFPHSASGLASSRTKEGTAVEEPPQGLLKIHGLPLLADRGVGMRAIEDDWAFTLSRRRLALKEWRLGPVDDEPVDETVGSGGGVEKGKVESKKGKGNMEF